MNTDDLGAQIRESLDQVHPGVADYEGIVRRARKRRQWRRAAATSAIGLAVLIGVVLAVAPSDGPLSPPTVRASSQLTLPGQVVDTATDEKNLWVLTCSGGCGGPPGQPLGHGDLVKIDNSTGRIVSTIEVEDPHALTVSDGSVWMIGFASGKVSRFNSGTGQLIATIPLSLPQPIIPGDRQFLPFDIAAGESAVWVSSGRGYVAQINASINQVERVIETLPDLPGEVVVDHGSVWIAAQLRGVLRIDEESGRVVTTPPIEASDGRRLSVSALAAADGSVLATGLWAEPHGPANFVAGDEQAIVQLDPETAGIERVVSFKEGISIRATSHSRIWLADRSARAVYVLNPGAQSVDLAARLRVRGTVLAAIGRSLWVARPHQTLQKYVIPKG